MATLRLYVEPSCSCNRCTILPEVRAMHLPCGVFLYARWLFLQRTSENAVYAKFAEFFFHALR